MQRPPNPGRMRPRTALVVLNDPRRVVRDLEPNRNVAGLLDAGAADIVAGSSVFDTSSSAASNTASAGIAIRSRYVSVPFTRAAARFVAVTMQTSRRWRRAVSAPCTPSLSLGVAAAGAAGPLGGENQCPNGSQEKIAGTRSDPDDCNRLEPSRLQKSGRWDSNPRRPAWEGGGKTSAECSTRQFSSEDAMLDA